jgi:uncharacterized protein (TIGR02145 family)
MLFFATGHNAAHQPEAANLTKSFLRMLHGPGGGFLEKSPLAAGGKKLETGAVLDINGNVYKTVKIGEQWWMAENLRVTKNRSGHPIRSYCYNDDESYCEKYGRLYTWDVITPEPVGEHDLTITPPGWHIPSEAEWEELVKTLGGEEKVAEMICVGGPTGFNAQLSGGSDFKSDYLNLDKSAMFWSSTVVNEDQVYRMGINDKGKWVKYKAFKEARLHIRCVKDKN